MNSTIVDSEVPLQLVVSSGESAGQVVLKIPPRTRIIVGDTIQIKRKPSNKKKRNVQDDSFQDHFSLHKNANKEPSSLPPSVSREPMKDEQAQIDNTLTALLRRARLETPCSLPDAHLGDPSFRCQQSWTSQAEEESNEYFSLDANACKEPVLWNNIQLKPDVYTGQLTPISAHSLDSFADAHQGDPSEGRHDDRIQWSQFGQEDSNWYNPLPPLDLQNNPNYEDLTPSSKQIIDEIREMNLWNDDLSSENDIEIDEAYQLTECQEVKGIDDNKMNPSIDNRVIEVSYTDSDDDIQIDQLDLCEEQLHHLPCNEEVLNERSDSLDTAEVLSEFDICDKV
jgi:hypothetical protein